MVGSDWSRAYAESWNSVFNSTPGNDESEYFIQKLMHPFFRLDLILNFDLAALVAKAHVPSADEVIEDFDTFVASRSGHQLMQSLSVALNDEDDEYARQLDTFQQRLDYFMQLPDGDAQNQAFVIVCSETSRLLELIIDNGFSDSNCTSFCPSVLNGLLIASLRIHGSLSHHDIRDLWAPLVDQIVGLVNKQIHPDINADLLNRHVYFVAGLFGFLHLTYIWSNGESHNSINNILSLKRQIGSLRWRQLDGETRFIFSVVILHSVYTLYSNNEPFTPRTGVSTDSLLLLRQTLNDTSNVIKAEGGSMYVPMIRYFIGRIDEGLTYSAQLYRTEIDNFTEADQFEIQRLVERFHHYRYAVTEERLVGFLSQFDTPRRMQLVIRLLRQIKFYKFSDLQTMIENSFCSFEDYENISTVVPLGNVSGSTAMMSYLAAHGKINGLNFQPDIERALENTEDGTPICLVDDASFSGVQLLNIFNDLLGTRDLKPHHTKYCDPLSKPDLFRVRPIRICLALATDEGLTKLYHEFQNMRFTDIQIKVCHIETIQQKPFSPSMSYIWDTPDDQREVREIFSEIGKELLSERAAQKNWSDERIEESSLGFGGDERLIVYQYNVPKSTLTALWEHGEYHGREWKPLFPAND